MQFINSSESYYEKRLRKPFNIEWQFIDEEKLDDKVLKLPRDVFVILLDERGKILDSPALAETLREPLETGREVVLVLGVCHLLQCPSGIVLVVHERSINSTH